MFKSPRHHTAMSQTQREKSTILTSSTSSNNKATMDTLVWNILQKVGLVSFFFWSDIHNWMTLQIILGFYLSLERHFSFWLANKFLTIYKNYESTCVWKFGNFWFWWMGSCFVVGDVYFWEWGEITYIDLNFDFPGDTLTGLSWLKEYQLWSASMDLLWCSVFGELVKIMSKWLLLCIPYSIKINLDHTPFTIIVCEIRMWWLVSDYVFLETFLFLLVIFLAEVTVARRFIHLWVEG